VCSFTLIFTYMYSYLWTRFLAASWHNCCSYSWYFRTLTSRAIPRNVNLRLSPWHDLFISCSFDWFSKYSSHQPVVCWEKGHVTTCDHIPRCITLHTNQYFHQLQVNCT
jgi:hypothetical protein